MRLAIAVGFAYNISFIYIKRNVTQFEYMLHNFTKGMPKLNMPKSKTIITTYFVRMKSNRYRYIIRRYK